MAITVRPFRLSEATTEKERIELLNQFVRDVQELEDRLDDLQSTQQAIQNEQTSIATDVESIVSSPIVAWGRATTDGAGSVTLNAGENTSVAIQGNNIRVTFTTALPDTNYAVVTSAQNNGTAISAGVLDTSITTTRFDIDTDYNGSDISASTNVIQYHFIVLRSA